MKILITGNAGFIGSHVGNHFFKKCDVVGIDNLSTGKKENIRANSNYFDDITNSDSVRAIFKSFRPEICIHLAAQPSLIESQTDPIKDAKTNIIGTINVVQACKEIECAQLIFSSTSAVYCLRANIPTTELSETSPVSNYGISKLAAEQYIKNSGVPFTILRFGNVYGPNQVPLGENQLIPRVLSHIYNEKEFSIYGRGQQLRDYIYVSDVVSAIEHVIIHPTYGVYNVSTEIGSRTTDVVLQIMELTGKHFDLVFSNKGDNRNIILSNVKLRKTGWNPKVTLKEGLQKTIEAWKK